MNAEGNLSHFNQKSDRIKYIILRHRLTHVVGDLIYVWHAWLSGRRQMCECVWRCEANTRRLLYFVFAFDSIKNNEDARRARCVLDSVFSSVRFYWCCESENFGVVDQQIVTNASYRQHSIRRNSKQIFRSVSMGTSSIECSSFRQLLVVT